MPIEIYLPCEPKWLCEMIGIALFVIAVLLVIAFFLVLYREYKALFGHKASPKKRTAKRPRKKK